MHLFRTDQSTKYVAYSLLLHTSNRDSMCTFFLVNVDPFILRSFSFICIVLDVMIRKEKKREGDRHARKIK